MDYIDDEDFVRSWVNERMSKKGKIVLRQELFKKGINKDLIEKCLEDIDDIKEYENAREIINSKKKFKDINDKNESFKKIISHLVRRGFTYDVAKKVFEEQYKK